MDPLMDPAIEPLTDFQQNPYRNPYGHPTYGLEIVHWTAQFTSKYPQPGNYSSHLLTLLTYSFGPFKKCYFILLFYCHFFFSKMKTFALILFMIGTVVNLGRVAALYRDACTNCSSFFGCFFLCGRIM